MDFPEDFGRPGTGRGALLAQDGISNEAVTLSFVQGVGSPRFRPETEPSVRPHLETGG